MIHVQPLRQSHAMLQPLEDGLEDELQEYELSSDEE